MTMNDPDMNALHLSYSPTAFYSVGVLHEYMREPGARMDSVELGNLLKRWNYPDSQANLYLQSGLGIAYGGGDMEPAAYTGLSADWEDRRFLTSYTNRFFYGGDIDRYARHTARIGVAPYIGDYGDVHTWLMLQADYDAGKKDHASLTPLVRLFKSTFLMEAGYNLDGGALLNFTAQF
ncbi:MAG: hypothetical protein K9G62_04240 [Alphaproteobacteria bacterium]|nr:hypothetical protein [Alphaproteobacteria bacterium]